ncbi:cobalt ECF transporter T component CbiQ [Kutzneria viridogrisea]|uniref:Cobalt ABC transporter, inner membrane subunit CbiQ n=2 Tax=Kutzneria TaxID=43356 RepID=W5W2U9_9PSEU|nr:cobalt ECF transporter T component CbiQ [Kutzneria albida]AHH94826.1 cobalt ABC transporter, inner membrane subunit CbiQ [Kutzneria albida DSM 43870]MBA8927830.1 cobalt/nickel transport system permease protein [Kutzneria viridogrisea]
MSGAAHNPGADLLIPADTPLHRAAPQCKVAATALCVLFVACTPKQVFWPYLGYAAVLALAAAIAQVPATTLLRRLVVEIPFVFFVVLLPLLATGPTVELLGVHLSVDGLESAASIVLKASFGLLATGVLAATTPLAEIITGLERLRVPRVFTAVASFMVRYVEVLNTELARLRTARACRGGDPRWLWQARDTAACVGALFVRAFERGERVYLAMASRGYNGALPTVLTGSAAGARAWTVALAVPLVYGALALTGWVTR